MPAGAVVALFSGWESRVNDARKFFGLDDKGGYHFPDFHVEAVQFLQEQRQVKGIGTDTLSLDPGVSADFPVHHYWLNQNKWGLENVAGLGQLPGIIPKPPSVREESSSGLRAAACWPGPGPGG
jgi:kynurenine formamidase